LASEALQASRRCRRRRWPEAPGRVWSSVRIKRQRHREHQFYADSVSDEKQPKQEHRAWRVHALVLAPMLTSNTLPRPGQKLECVSRILPRVVTYDDLTVALLPSAATEEEGSTPEVALGQEWAHLIANVPQATTTNEAVEATDNVFESIIDSLSFVLGAPLRLGAFDVVDITQPVSEGDVREVEIYSGPPSGTNVSSVEMECIRGSQFVTLPDVIPELDAKVSAALRWFYKSLNTALLHDQFIFLWISLENLCDMAPLSISGPYKGPCGHAIRCCPECGRSTDKEIRGPTIKHYLEVSFGITKETSSALWRMRQMMHGDINFDPRKMQDLPKLIQPLRAAVASGIKRHLQMDNHAAPQVLSAGFSINPCAGLGGTRSIRAVDIEPLANKVARYEASVSNDGTVDSTDP
jgi:hypothetical protein